MDMIYIMYIGKMLIILIPIINCFLPFKCNECETKITRGKLTFCNKCGNPFKKQKICIIINRTLPLIISIISLLIGNGIFAVNGVIIVSIFVIIIDISIIVITRIIYRSLK